MRATTCPSPRSRRLRTVPSIAAALALALGGLAGCKRSGEIGSYNVPKEEQPAAAQPPMDPAGDMAAALPDGTMAWTLPEGWRDVPNPEASPFSSRVATLMVGEGDDAIEVAVSNLAGIGGGIAANINRWRDQVGLPAETQAALVASSLSIVTGHGVRGVVVDLAGPAAHGSAESAPRMFAAIFPARTQTWFIKTTSSRDALEPHRDAFLELCNSVRFDEDSPPPQPAPPPSGTPTTAPAGDAAAGGGSSGAGGGGIVFGATPTGWSVDGQPKPMSVVSFTVAEGTQTASMTVTPLGGGQDPLMNVNRWRGQVGLGPAASMAETAPQTITIGGVEATLIDLAGSSGHTIAAMLEHEGKTWFFKLTGPDPLVGSQHDAFASFLGTARFEDGG